MTVDFFPLLVDDLLKMACSSVLPGGGANTEYVLHCLFECRGDFMVSILRVIGLALKLVLQKALK